MADQLWFMTRIREKEEEDWVLTSPTHGGMAQVELTWVPCSVPRWFT